jgi:hypothetical protein
MSRLAHWCFIRGVNQLIPHAFYYSMRGPRRDERPPDVGPHAIWWDQYGKYAAASRRLSWLNTDSQHICHTAILGKPYHLPWQAAKVCFQHQRDFNYLEERHLWEDAQVDETGIRLGSLHYQALIVEVEADKQADPALEILEQAGRVIRYDPNMSAPDLITWLDTRIPADIRISPETPGLRVRHVIKAGWHYFMLFNETHDPVEITIELPLSGAALVYDVWHGTSVEHIADKPLALAGHEFQVVMVPVGHKNTRVPQSVMDGNEE